MNRTASLISLPLCLVLFLALAGPLIADPPSDGDDLVIGHYRTIHSDVLGEDRLLSIYLPYGYAEVDDRFPVLYLNGAMTYLHVMQAAVTTEKLDGQGKTPQMIVVVVDNIDGSRDYMPVPTPNRPNGGKSDEYLSFMLDELIPFINTNYRTVDYRILSGFSTAGIFVVNTFLSNPEAFDAYIAASAELGWANDHFTKAFQERLPVNNSMKKSIYLSYGSDDYQESVVDVMPSYIQMLEDLAPDNLRWSVEMVEDGGHVPYTTLYNGLSFAFSGWQFPNSELQERGLSGLKDFYSNLSVQYGFPIKVPGSLLRTLGASYLQDEDQINNAVEVFKYYVESHPEVADAHYCLGAAYYRLKKSDLARACFEKALDIMPTYLRAARILERMDT
ncbi:MAG: tetratricopeptide repeat protein, partial [FCB group bacterium]|nr:tetratricopeptide repeat protein [FCB group bacterium]